MSRIVKDGITVVAVERTQRVYRAPSRPRKLPNFDSCCGDRAIDRPLSPFCARAESAPAVDPGQFPIRNRLPTQPSAMSQNKGFDRSRWIMLTTQ